jgi:hypothetical protein
VTSGPPPLPLLGRVPDRPPYTAFNADYYGGIIRAYFDGKMDWLNTVERGQDYAPRCIWWRSQP